MQLGKFILGLVLLFSFHFINAQQLTQAQYEPGIVVFKLKNTTSKTSSAGARTITTASYSPNSELAANLAKKIGAKKAFPAIPQPPGRSNKAMARTSSTTDPFARIFKLELQPGQNVQEVIQQLLSSKEVEYAEPYYLPKLLHTPNDEFIGQQDYLNKIKAIEGWDISQGSRDIIIGILDTGVDFSHPDLQENLHLNSGDPIDGIDNDGDGYIDNYRGWDFGNNDNDPSDTGGHGTFVTGFSSASTNNDIGISGTGYKCRYMPIKIFRSESGFFSNGYEAMVYAADMGCQVLNLSWGAEGSRSQYVQDIINYVVLEKDVVIVAAAGNTSKELDFYPASYDNVLSVSSSDINDQKSEYATWSKYVDILAPGNNVYSTSKGGGYGRAQGTSYSTPIVAGAAALLRSYFPNLTAQQVMERLRVSADDVSQIGRNTNYTEKIGKGRLNIRTALDNASSPAVRMQQFEINNGSGPFAFYNDTVEIRMEFKNFLFATTNLQIEISTSSPYVTIIEDKIQLGAIQTMENLWNESQPFKVYLHPDLPNNEVITFRLGYTDLNYTDYQHFEFRSSGEYLDFKTDSLSLTVSSNGNLGYNTDYNLNGTGFRHLNKPLAHNIGLVIAQSENAVANNMVKIISPAIRNQDFRTLSRLKLFKNSIAYRDARSAFETIPSDSVPLKLLVEQKILGWKEAQASSSIILEYRITNRADTAYDQLRAGLYADFDINDLYRNKADWDAEYFMGYTYDHEESRYAGLVMLTGNAVGYHALDIASRNGNTTEIMDSLSRAQKYGYLGNGIGKQSAGLAGGGNDVAQFLGGKLPPVAPNQSKKIAFALLTASSLEGLQQEVSLAKQRYQQYLNEPPVFGQLFICPGESPTISGSEGESYAFYTDPFGNEHIASGPSLILDPVYKDTIIYLANISSQEWAGDIGRVLINVKEPLAAFSLSSDTLSINPGETATLQLNDQSINAVAWYWDFNNGYQSKKQSPKAFFSSPGVYNIQLEVNSLANCTASTSKKVVVVYKNPVPQLDDQLLCTSGSAIIESENNLAFNLFTAPEKGKKIFSGTSFTTPVLSKSTTYYASSGSGAYESDLVPLTLNVFQAKIDYTYEIDSTATDKYALKLKATTSYPAGLGRIDWFVNGTFKGNGNELLLPYNKDENAITVQAIANYLNGCQAEKLKVISLSPSTLPLIPAFNICKGSAVCIRPADEGLYYFYSSPDQQILLRKGREYTTEPLSENSTLYVTNVSQGLESDPVMVNILILEGLAHFTASADTISPGATVHFKSTHPDIRQWSWNFGNGITSELKEPEQRFEEAGIYEVTLTAVNASGCEEMSNHQIVVLQTTHIPGQEANKNLLTTYPNPVADHVLIRLPVMDSNGVLVLRDINGRKILSRSIPKGLAHFNLDMQGLSPACYVLELHTTQKFFQSRIIKE